MRIALIGARGQLGHELSSLLRDDLTPLGHQEIELTDGASVEETLTRCDPGFVINAAAYNFVDRAEDEPDVAFAVNALGPRHLGQFCGPRDIPFLHVSSDYVFGKETSKSTPYVETDTPAPISAYGVSKLAGEWFVQSLCRRHFVVRTCGLYGLAAAQGAGKGNFVETMLRLGSERDEVKVVDDQFCTPTSAADSARAIAALIETEAYGLYHATNSGNTTWCGFAREIFRVSNKQVKVTAISTSQFRAKARRPYFSVLDNQKISGVIGGQLPHWKDALDAYLANRPS